jgi:hypothetical protein
MDRDQTLATAKVYGISGKPDLDGACARADGGREGGGLVKVLFSRVSTPDW